MSYDFDKQVIPNKYAGKWFFHGDPKEIYQMWIADMDFEVCDKIRERLARRLEEGVYGYTFEADSYKEAIIHWERRHCWEIEKEWIVSCTGVIQGLNLAIQALTQEGDNVVLHTPFYHSFYNCLINNKRNPLLMPLKYSSDGYKMDLQELEMIISEKGAACLILCNPHNPTGRVFTYDELKGLVELCKKYNVKIIADEIHQDIVYSQYEHITLGRFKDIYDQIIVLTSPTKAFNLAGIKVANALIPNEEIRNKFTLKKKQNGPTSLNIFALEACEAAYMEGEKWLKELIAYLEENRAFFLQYMQEHMPQLKVLPPEGTYFMWIDCSSLGLSDEELDKFFLEKAHIRTSAGNTFDVLSSQFVRINIGCRHQYLKEALCSLNKAINW